MKGLTFAVAALAAGMVQAGATLDYAKTEAERLFARAKVPAAVTAPENPLALTIALNDGKAPSAPSVAEVGFDGYACTAAGGSFAIAAREE